MGEPYDGPKGDEIFPLPSWAQKALREHLNGRGPRGQSADPPAKGKKTVEGRRSERGECKLTGKSTGIERYRPSRVAVLG